MVVWGGTDDWGVLATGGRYCVAGCLSPGTWYRDDDVDGYGTMSVQQTSCVPPEGYAAATGDCNDADAAIHPGATEQCNGVDDDCDGTVDNAAPPAGSPDVDVTEPAPGTARIEWSALGSATGYDLVRGGLTNLEQSDGDFTVSTDACLAMDFPGTEVDDPAAPSAGTGVWYLVRARNCGGAESYDSGAPSQVGSRDAEIDASAGHCP